MFFLAIESSCDETSLAILYKTSYKSENKNNKTPLNGQNEPSSFYEKVNNYKILASLISSQIDIHKLYGGVIPEIGAREHAQNIHPLFENLLAKSFLHPSFVELIKTENLNSFDKLNSQEVQLKFFYKNLEKIYITNQPGLVSALKVGIEFGKSLQFFIDKTYEKKVEINLVNHLHGHVASCFFQIKEKDFLDNKVLWKPKTDSNSDLNISIKKTFSQNLDSKIALENQRIAVNQSSSIFESSKTRKKDYTDDQIFPHLHLLVSGGNSQLIWLESWQKWVIIGQTLDDAAGETLDKVGRMLGLDYPAGSTISKIAGALDQNPINLPVGMLKSSSLDFSFSGLKTAVRYLIQKQKFSNWQFEKRLSKEELKILLSNQDNHSEIEKSEHLNFIKQICISTQLVTVQQLVNKTKQAIKQKNPVSLGLSGGVSANPLLRQKLQQVWDKELFLPNLALTGDNAVMIALAGLMSDKI